MKNIELDPFNFNVLEEQRTITFQSGPDYKKAMNALEKMSDRDLENKAAVADKLRKMNLDGPASDIENMSSDEYDDFLMNNVFESEVSDIDESVQMGKKIISDIVAKALASEVPRTFKISSKKRGETYTYTIKLASGEVNVTIS